jgi:hypothetical protein
MSTDFNDDESTLICVGKFAATGVPLISSRHLSQQATVTFQAISLHKMFGQLIRDEPLKVAYIRHEDGTIIRIEPHPDGYVAYLDA